MFFQLIKRNALAKKGMTLIEILIVSSLFSVISIAIYNVLSNGIKVWDRSHDMVMEEDIVIFFDKLSTDLRNSFSYSKIRFEGGDARFSFPTIVKTVADTGDPFEEDEFEYIDQIGRVEYYFDINDKSIYRRVANYSQALKQVYEPEKPVIQSINSLKFQYVYIADNEEIRTAEVFEFMPASVEVEVEFTDRLGKRVMRKIINIPVGA